MITSVTLNPAFDRTIYVGRLLPNDTNRVIRTELDAGGKGINASRVLKELGSQTLAIGFLGGSTGKFIEHVLNLEGIPTDFVHIEGETRTNIAIEEEDVQVPPTTFNERGPLITDLELEELFIKVRKAAMGSSITIIGGSLPPGVPSDVYKRLVAVVQEAGSKAILDSDGEPMRIGLTAGPFMIKPNRTEVKRLVDIDIQNIDDAVKAANLLAEYGVEIVVISAGGSGAYIRTAEGFWHATPPKVESVSTIGSGDSMVAGIAHILNQGGHIEEAAKWGTAAGAATAMTSGAEISKRPQVLALLDKVKIERIR